MSRCPDSSCSELEPIYTVGSGVASCSCLTSICSSCVFVDAELPSEWHASRRYSEFYVLENKLSEFHGSLSPAHLPPKKLLGRNLEYLKSKCAEFERFLKVWIS